MELSSEEEKLQVADEEDLSHGSDSSYEPSEESSDHSLPAKSLASFFQDERIMQRVGDTYYLFTIKLIRLPKGDELLINATNLNSDEDFEIHIHPTDIFGKHATSYFEHFCSEIFQNNPSTEKESSHKMYELTEKLFESRGRFMKSLLWLKLLVSNSIRGSKTFASEIYQVGYDELATFGKFVQYNPQHVVKRKGEIAGLVMGIGSRKRRMEFGIQIPKVLKTTDECIMQGQSDYLKQYELLYKERDSNETYVYTEETDGKWGIENREAEKIHELEEQCKELKKALRDMQKTEKK